MAKLFISHASEDKRLVTEFTKLLEGGIGVPPSEIFCSSTKGQGIPPGKDFKSYIKETLGDSTLVLALVSDDFYQSPFCMCELGGAWFASKDFIPVIVPPVSYSNMKAVLAGMQALKIETNSGLDDLHYAITERLPVPKPLPTARWSERRDEFLEILPSLLKGPAPSKQAGENTKPYDGNLTSRYLPPPRCSNCCGPMSKTPLKTKHRGNFYCPTCDTFA